jgi:hypothetical protein
LHIGGAKHFGIGFEGSIDSLTGAVWVSWRQLNKGGQTGLFCDRLQSKLLVARHGVQSMKKMWLWFSLFCCTAAWSSDTSCYSIHKPDRKNVCLALSKKQNSYCHAVKDADTKNMCLANVMHQQSYCHAIREHDLKQQCLAQVKSP